MPAERADLATRAPADPDPNLSKCLLVVHQDPGIREILRSAFEQAGWQVHAADTAASAASAFKSGPFDGALVDLLMPGVAPDQVLDLTGDTDRSSSKVLFITGYVVNQTTVGFLITSNRPSSARLYRLGELVELLAA